MSNVINLNKVRKRKAKEAKERRADTNRRLHGRTKAERAVEELQKKMQQQRVDGAKREAPAPLAGDDEPTSSQSANATEVFDRGAEPASVERMPVNQLQPIQLYFFRTPNGLKISIALEEFGVPYEVQPIHIGRGEQLTPEFSKISPNHKIPAIVDPEGPGGAPLSVFESGAILQYLGRKFERFYPSDERARVEVDQWLFWQVGGLGPMAGQANHFRLYAKETIPYAIERYTTEVTRLLGVMDQRLTDRDFLAGEYSIADMACIAWVESQKPDFAALPQLGAWFARVLGRPAVERGLSVGKSPDKP